MKINTVIRLYHKYYLNIHWKDWCWSWNSNTLATWCEELTHRKRPWWLERLKAGGEGDDRGWDGWMASPTWWTWVCASYMSWWWTGKPSMWQSMASERVKHDWVTELYWTERWRRQARQALNQGCWVPLDTCAWKLWLMFEKVFKQKHRAEGKRQWRSMPASVWCFWKHCRLSAETPEVYVLE